MPPGQSTNGQLPIKGEFAPPENMRTIGESEYGSSYYTIETLWDTKNHYQLKTSSRNWDPENLFHGIIMLSMSIKNIVAFLKLILTSGKEDGDYSWPEDIKAFSSPWSKSTCANNFCMSIKGHEQIPGPFTDEEIKQIYKIPVRLNTKEKEQNTK